MFGDRLRVSMVAVKSGLVPGATYFGSPDMDMEQDLGRVNPMHWTRIEPRGLVGQLGCEPATPDDEGLASQALAHVSAELLSGRYIAVQNGEGALFIGTPEEAAEHMLGRIDA